ncbi:MAG: pseudouridylate synthase [Betaproteobacteria bacterium]|nr:pseudouridylate synthase [Betaproteobacteria bacterium]
MSGTRQSNGTTTRTTLSGYGDTANDAPLRARHPVTEARVTGRPHVAADAGALEILDADDWIVAIHKPPGLLVHRSDLDRHETRFAVQLLRDQIGREVHPAHRLDKPTSGVLLFAFDRGVCRQLSLSFEAGTVSKQYLAIVRGHPPESFAIDHPLTRIVDEPGVTRTASGSPQAARTLGRTLATTELPHRVDRYATSRYALVELVPVTGRRHQLRRHLKHANHPIVGDSTYGKSRHNRLFETLFGSRRLLLACTCLSLPHPVTREQISIRAAPEPGFMHVIDALGWRHAIDGRASHEPAGH